MCERTKLLDIKRDNKEKAIILFLKVLMPTLYTLIMIINFKVLHFVTIWHFVAIRLWNFGIIYETNASIRFYYLLF